MCCLIFAKKLITILSLLLIPKPILQNTNSPAYASGQLSGNQLQAVVGGLDNAQITTGMSAGWDYDFTLPAEARVQVVFDWVLTKESDYESDEYSEVVVALDGEEVVIQRLTGDGNGGTSDVATGTAETVSWSGVTAGTTHTITVGVYNNKKTFNNEFATVEIDNVVISSFTLSTSPPSPTPLPTPAVTPAPITPPPTPAPVPAATTPPTQPPTNPPTAAPITPPPTTTSSVITIVDANFEAGTDGFTYEDDTFQVSIDRFESSLCIYV